MAGAEFTVAQVIPAEALLDSLGVGSRVYVDPKVRTWSSELDARRYAESQQWLVGGEPAGVYTITRSGDRVLLSRATTTLRAAMLNHPRVVRAAQAIAEQRREPYHVGRSFVVHLIAQQRPWRVEDLITALENMLQVPELADHVLSDMDDEVAANPPPEAEAEAAGDDAS